MQNAEKQLTERFLNFDAAIIELAIKLNKTAVGRHIAG